MQKIGYFYKWLNPFLEMPWNFLFNNKEAEDFIEYHKRSENFIVHEAILGEEIVEKSLGEKFAKEIEKLKKEQEKINRDFFNEQ